MKTSAILIIYGIAASFAIRLLNQATGLGTELPPEMIANNMAWLVAGAIGVILLDTIPET